MPANSSPLNAMVTQAESLYSLPAVAMEVLRLTDNALVDTQSIKDCIERDPALAAKLLRVVNSSLFGLSGKVENLTQAIALLGVKPLKLLVLGFSLPSDLLDDLDREQLQHYWRGSLTRAVAARQLMESQWNAPGDDVFLIALLQDIGLLVLLQQLGTPYAKFLIQAREEKQDLLELEHDSLGFDHRQLTVEVLRKWRLPAVYTDAILQPTTLRNTADEPQSIEATAQVLKLANLLAELVDEHRLSVLPDLLRLGEKFVGLNKDDLNTLVAEIDPQVEQLAKVLKVELGNSESYAAVLTDAHDRLSLLAEQAAAELASQDELLCNEVLNEAQELQQALRNFTRKSLQANPRNDARADEPNLATPPPRGRGNAPASNATIDNTLLSRVTMVVTKCREQRQSVCLLQLEPSCDNKHGSSHGSKYTPNAAAALKQIVVDVANEYDIEPQHILPAGGCGYLILLADFERRKAVSLGKEISNAFNVQRDTESHEPLGASDSAATLKGGVAFLPVVPKAFEPQRLLSAVQGCLAAARSAGGGSIKSIEVF